MSRILQGREEGRVSIRSFEMNELKFKEKHQTK
jgi:hypothetical protein